MSYFRVFFGESLQKRLSYMKSAPRIFQNVKFCAKQNKKKIKFGIKNVLCGYFKLEFGKAIVIFDASILEFVKTQSFLQKFKIFEFGTENVWFGYFLTEIFKKLVPLNFVKMHKFALNIISDFGPKTSLLGFLDWSLKKTFIIFEISTLKFVEKPILCNIKILTFGIKHALCDFFLAAILKPIVMFKISTFEIVKLQSFVQKQKILKDSATDI